MILTKIRAITFSNFSAYYSPGRTVRADIRLDDRLNIRLDIRKITDVRVE